MRIRCMHLPVLCFMGFLLFCNITQAQSTQGAIIGIVKDSSGAVVPGAKVTLFNEDGGSEHDTLTDPRGNYQILNLEPSHYRVEVTLSGFDKSIEQNLLLSSRQELRVDIVLQVSNVAQQVMVNAADLGAITTDTPSIAATLDARDVLSLPANYRGAGSTSPLNVIQALPGVQADSGAFPPTPTASGTPSINFSIQGGLPSQSETTVDGISAQNVLTNNPLSDAFPSAESIAEIRVDGVSNNAEFGQPGEITTVSKSGTNSLHGAGFWYFQNSGFDARPFGSIVKPKKVGNDFGGSIGGPVVIPGLYNGHNKTFFFGTYEGFEYPQAKTVHWLVPTDLMKQGNFGQEPGKLTNPFTSGGYQNNTLPGINPAAQAFLKLFPSPNYGSNLSQAAAESSIGYNYIANLPNNYESKQFDIRLDHYFGEKALLFGRYTWKNIGLLSPNNLLLPESTQFDRYRILVTSFSYNLKPNLINEFRFGFTLESYGKSNPFNGASVTNAANLAGVGPTYPFNGITEINFTNLTSLNAARLNDTSAGRLFQYNDNLTWSKGSHTLKVGLDIRHVRATPPTSFFGADNYGTFNFSGMFTGNEFADFLLGLPQQSEVDNLPGEYAGQTSTYAFYAQDNWKVSPNFTAEYGIRYELHPPYSDPGGDIGNFDPSVPLSGRAIYPAGHESILAPGYLADFNACPVAGVNNPYATGRPQNGAPCTPVVPNTAVGLPAGLRNYSKVRFSPRIGFAWRPFGNDSTAVRGGFGVYNITTLGSGYYSMTAALQANTRIFTNTKTASGPAFQWPNTNGGGTNISPPTYGTAYFGTGNSINWKDPYSLQWDLSVDHAFGKGVGTRISYIGMKTNDLVWGPDVNNMSYSSTTPALKRPLSDRPFPNWGIINMRNTGAQANYQSLQLEARRRLSTGLEFNSAYTFAKNLADNAGTNPTAFATENGGRATYVATPAIDYGNVYGTRRHRWITTSTYVLPFGRGQRFGSGMNRWEDAVLGGWRLSNIFLLQSGPWLTPYIPGGVADPSGTGSGIITGRPQRPDRIGNGIPSIRTRSAWLDASSFACPSNSGYSAKSHAGNACTVGVSSAPIGRFGTSSVGDVEGPGTVNLSSGLSKVFRVTERVNLRAEGTFTNVLNHANLADPNLNTTSGSFGKIIAARGSDFAGSRTGQVSLRLEF
ncbi:MAG TPA: TonB-dependent receptor [Acidobacteriaceae bacterium]